MRRRERMRDPGKNVRQGEGKDTVNDKERERK